MASASPPLPVQPRGADARPFGATIPEYTDMDRALQMFRHPRLLNLYWRQLLRVVTLIEKNEGSAGPHKFDTTLYWDLLKERKMAIYCFGEKHAGKSQLIQTLTGSEKAKPSAGDDRTMKEIPCEADSGIVMWDSKGFNWPTPEPDASQVEELQMWRAAYKEFQMRIAFLEQRIRKGSAKNRPVAVCVCLKADMPPPRRADIVAMLKASHSLLVPTFLVLTQIYSCSTPEALTKAQDFCASIVAEVGENGLGERIRCHSVNSVTFYSSTEEAEPLAPTGIAELISSMLQCFTPVDGLTFARKPKESGGMASAAKSGFEGLVRWGTGDKKYEFGDGARRLVGAKRGRDDELEIPEELELPTPTEGEMQKIKDDILALPLD